MNVYIFVQRDSLSKIGKANDVEKRFWQLGGTDRFIEKGHYYVPMKTESDAFLLERCLHRIFAHCKIRTNSQAGHTELFEAHVLSKALRLLRQNNGDARDVTVDQWVTEGALLDQIGRKVGIWHGCPHSSTHWRNWKPILSAQNKITTVAPRAEIRADESEAASRSAQAPARHGADSVPTFARESSSARRQAKLMQHATTLPIVALGAMISHE